MKHFFKILTVFLVIIILGLIGVFLAGSLFEGGETANSVNNIAK